MALVIGRVDMRADAGGKLQVLARLGHRGQVVGDDHVPEGDRAARRHH